MKNFTLHYFKAFLFSLILLLISNYAEAWDKDDLEIVSENTTDGRAIIHLTCYEAGPGYNSNIWYNLWLEVQINGKWTSMYRISQTVYPYISGNYNFVGSILNNGPISDRWYEQDNNHKWIREIQLNKSPTGVYNSPVRFRIVDQDSETPDEFTLTFYKPNPPQNLTASRDECNKIEVSWDAPDNYRSDGTVNEYYLDITKNGDDFRGERTTATSYTYTTPDDGFEYGFYVRFVATPYVRSDISNEVSGYSKAKPEAPNSVTTSTDRCDGTVRVQWQWNESSPEKYEVQRSTSEGGTYISLNNDISGDRNYLDDTIPNRNTYYYYKVRALNECDDWGEFSEPEFGYSPDAPADPSNFNYIVANKSIVLSWLDNSAYEDSYTLVRTNKTTGVISEYELDIDTEEFIDDDAQYCIPYKYELKAVNSCGKSGVLTINDVLLTPDLSDTFWEGALKASKGYYPDVVHLEWKNNNRQELDLFYIYRKVYGSTDSTLLSTLAATESMFDDKYTENGVLYEYSIVAEKLCNGQSVFSNVGVDVGFKFPTATVTGRVTFPAGTGVGGVSISASTTDVIPATSLSFENGSYISIPQTEELNIESAFTFQTYLKFNGANDYGIFEKSGNYSLTYENGKFRFYVCNEFVEIEKEMTGNEFVHVSCVFDGNTAFVYIPDIITDADGSERDTLLSTSLAITNGISNNTSEIQLGFSNGLGFSGNIDEVRLWGRALNADEILNDYNRYLSGKEEKMLGYWRMNEGFGTHIYDISKTGSTFNENHGEFVNANVAWSATYPTLEQLGYRGITDLEGNYIIAGIPFTTGGSSYKFTPMMAPHEFSPDYKILFLNEDAPVINNVDFIDESVTSVSLTVYYDNTSYPVKDVMVKVDGIIISDDNNEMVATDELGTATFEVPLGSHYLSFEKANHTFNNPFFPAKDSLGNIQRHNFQKALNINITDLTRVKLAGKIAGGPVEADKNLGSNVNPGINNIGVVNVELITVKGAIIDTSTNSKTISFKSDENTGEYEIWLLPEKYKANGDLAIKNTRYKFNSDEDKAIIDLSSQFFEMVETDSIFLNNPGEDPVFQGLDTVAIYNFRRDWIKRSEPDFAVVSSDGGKIISENKFGFEDENGVVDSIPLAIESDNNITYPFGKPIFFFGQEYGLLIKAFEEYINDDNGKRDSVPVTDGKVIIANNLALSEKDVELKLNSEGTSTYSFIADFPNIADPYTKNLNITFKSAGAQITWPTMEAYILGGRPVGNNFVTAGPELVDYILRDPPGSNSYAALSKGYESHTTVDWQLTNTTDNSVGFAYQLGVSVETSQGTPFLQIKNQFETDNFIGVTIETSTTLGGGLESTTSRSFNEGFSTSDDPDFVGSDGDVFIGHSTNIIYGISKIMGITPTSEIQTGNSAIAEHNTYSISIEDGLRVSPEFKTHFIYSQKIIEEEHIPHLKKLRNLIFERNSYQIVFSDINDPKYGANNDDMDVWGIQASDADNGPSYIYTPESGVEEDSVRHYNKMIAHWFAILKQNEKEKLEAKADDEHENISFGAGSTYESSIGNESSLTGRFVWDFSISAELAASLGFSINKAGFRFDGSLKNTTTSNFMSSGGSTDTDEVGYTLSDGDSENYITVDVLKCQNGHGPVFKLRGGQTSCPYEGEELTEYYEPGQHTLASATMKIDGPQLGIENPIAPIVPETSPALFTVYLSNVSEAEKDNWYVIGVDLNTNPNGAKVKMDGSSINEGISIFVPYGTTVEKTLEVYKGRADINDYENIGIYLSSQCDDDIADIKYISAYFASACSPVAFEYPGTGWVINADDNDTMYVIASGYNLQHDGFNDFHFQYTPSGTSDWTTALIYTNDPTKAGEQNTTYLDGAATVDFYWDMKSLPDRAYDIRLVSHCEDGSINYSEELSGILDGQRPQVFGTPQPADGILNVDDDIYVQFNEAIEGGLLNQSYFSIKGTLTNSPVKHDAFIRFNGTSDYCAVPEGVSFNDKSFTVEFWMKPDVYANSVIFSQGNDPAQNIEIGLRDADKTYFKIGGKEFLAPFQFSQIVPSTAWQHMAYVFDYETGDIFIYQNDVIILEVRGESIAINNKAKIYLGKSSSSVSDYFTGCLHELRIWSKIWSIGDIYANQYNMLSGNETGLYGYWPVNEAFGQLAADKAAYRHMEVFAPWEVYPGGKAWDFAGNSCLSFSTGYFAVIPEMDYTMEFWFKDATPSDTVCLFSNQKGDGKDGDGLKEKAFAVYATPDGKIYVASKGNIFQATTNNYFDNSWHHFALVVRRNGNVISYIDGEAQNEKENTVVGGIAGGEMSLGVRKWDNVKGTGEDWHYQGKIDEFRLWNLAKTITQIKMDMNSKLHSDEIGLMVYFPFEGYYDDGFGGLNMNETLENFVSDVNATNAVTCSAESYTDDSPNIKDARPIENIAFDFVASEDGIILKPKEYLLPQLEKNIIEITVEGVEDKYGNSLASPVTWTAYVHRNQIRWEDERRLFTKEIYKTLDFVASIKNTGGLQIGFELINLPAWLSAQPSSGVVNPESSLEITFTINPALNIGEYNEDIILRTENGYDEKLPISVKVYRTPPDWKVDPAKFEHTMNMVGRVKIEDVLSTDIFDRVAAFKKGTDSIRGVINVRYVSDFDSYLVFLSIYGNEVHEELEFRIWDASVGQILDEVNPDTILFVPNSVHGTTYNPIVFEAKNLFRQYIPLAKGWNWVSFNKLAHNQNNLNSFFSALEPLQNDQIKTHGNGFVNFDRDNGWIGLIDSIDNRRMYQIKLSEKDTIIYSGESIVPEDFPSSLSAGWNHIAYIPDLAMDVNDALRLYVPNPSEVIKSQYAFAMYDSRAGWLGTLNLMEPGLGYMINVEKDVEFRYPNTTLFKSGFVEQNISAPTNWENDLADFESSLSIVAKLDFTNTPELAMNGEMILGAFINDENRGFVSPLLNSNINYQPFFLSVSNNLSDKLIEFKLYDGSTGKTYAVEETIHFTPNAVCGSTKEPLILTIGNVLTGIAGMGELESNFKCYPNPFNNRVNVEFVGSSGEIQINVLNSTGAVVKQLFNAYAASGTNTVVWDGTNGNGTKVSSGVYYIRFISGAKVETVKISKSK